MFNPFKSFNNLIQKQRSMNHENNPENPSPEISENHVEETTTQNEGNESPVIETIEEEAPALPPSVQLENENGESQPDAPVETNVKPSSEKDGLPSRN